MELIFLMKLWNTEKNKGFVIKCEDIEKENENNSIIYKLIECSNTGLGKETISIIKIPK